LVEALTHVMEHEYFAKGLTETVLTTLWVVITKHLLQCTFATVAYPDENTMSDKHGQWGIYTKLKLHAEMYITMWSGIQSTWHANCNTLFCSCLAVIYHKTLF